MFSSTSGPLLGPSACQDEAGTQGPLLSSGGAEAKLLQSGGSGRVWVGSEAAPCSVSTLPRGRWGPSGSDSETAAAPKSTNRARDLFILSLVTSFFSPFFSTLSTTANKTFHHIVVPFFLHNIQLYELKEKHCRSFIILVICNKVPPEQSCSGIFLFF